MKRAVYFEDLQKDVFVILVEEGNGRWLEQRKWHKNDYEYSPGDEFDKARASGFNHCEKYEWIEERSDLLATCVNSENWTERKWVPVA